jgi:hypothetical protein
LGTEEKYSFTYEMKLRLSLTDLVGISSRDRFPILKSTIEGNIAMQQGDIYITELLSRVFIKANRYPVLFTECILPLLVHASKCDMRTTRIFLSAVANQDARLANTNERPDSVVLNEAVRIVNIPDIKNVIFNDNDVLTISMIQFVYVQVQGLFAWSTIDGIAINVYALMFARTSTLNHAFPLMTLILHEWTHFRARKVANDFNMSSPKDKHAQDIAQSISSRLGINLDLYSDEGRTVQITDKKMPVGDEFYAKMEFAGQVEIPFYEIIVKAASRLNAPSTFGKLSNWPCATAIGRDAHCLTMHHRPPGTEEGLLHISLFSRAFAQFFKISSDRTAITRDDCEFASQFVLAMSQV